MTKIIRAAEEEETKKISFFPFRNDNDRVRIFRELYAREQGLKVRPTQREVFHYILGFAEAELKRAQKSRNGHADPTAAPAPARVKKRK